MDWIVYAIAAALFASAYALAYRKVLVKESDAVAFATAEQLLAAVLLLPFVLLTPFEASAQGLPFLALSVLLWAAWSFTNVKSAQLLQASTKTILVRTELFWVLALGALVLGESVTLQKIAAIALIFLGGLFASKNAFLDKGSKQGIAFTLATAGIGALAFTNDKQGSRHFSPEYYSFLLFLLPGLLFLLSTGTKRTLQTIKRNAKGLVLVTSFNIASFYLVLLAYQSGEVSSVIPLLNLSLVLTTLGGIAFLGERENVLRKVAGMALVFLGALLIVA